MKITEDTPPPSEEITDPCLSVDLIGYRVRPIWMDHEMTAKYVWDQPRIKNGAPRMLFNRIWKTPLRKFVKARPQEAKDYLTQAS
jgi:hypothetical protein